MGPNQSANNKLSPEMIKMVLSDVKLLEMVGLKHTELDDSLIVGMGSYTERYDHGLIPLDALEEMIKSSSFSMKDLP